MSAAGRWADRFGVAVGYTLALATGTALLHAQPRPTRDAWLDLASTNLANATDHPFSTLLVSALFTDGDVRGWLVLSLVGLGTVGWRFGAWRTLTLVVAAHVLGTVISEGVVGIRIATGALPASAAHLRDIGPSYVVVAALVAGIAFGPWLAKLWAGKSAARWRISARVPNKSAQPVRTSSADVSTLVR